MSKTGGWVPLDKNLTKTLPHDRPYSIVEAVFSHTVDLDCGRNWSINGYAQLWGWSRNKVRKLVSELRTGRGHIADRKGTGKGHAIHYIDKGLWAEEDRKRTGRGQEEDRKKDTTVILNPNKEKPYRISDENAVEDFLLSKKKKRLSGKRLKTFLDFWDAFDLKKGKAEAADAWLEIPALTDALVEVIIKAARGEADRRAAIVAAGKTPKWPQGWLAGRRWEDEAGPAAKIRYQDKNGDWHDFQG